MVSVPGNPRQDLTPLPRNVDTETGVIIGTGSDWSCEQGFCARSRPVHSYGQVIGQVIRYCSRSVVDKSPLRQNCMINLCHLGPGSVELWLLSPKACECKRAVARESIGLSKYRIVNLNTRMEVRIRSYSYRPPPYLNTHTQLGGFTQISGKIGAKAEKTKS